MTIYTLCIDQERGRYLAISTTDPAIRCISYQSETEALGQLVATNPGILVEKVVSQCHFDIIEATIASEKRLLDYAERMLA